MNVCILTFQPLLSGVQMSVWGEKYLLLLIQIYRYVPNHRTEIPIFLTVCFIILSTWKIVRAALSDFKWLPQGPWVKLKFVYHICM